MDYHDLDLAGVDPIVISDRPTDLIDAIATAIGSETRFCGYTIARHGPQSCRVFFIEETGRDMVRDPTLETPSQIVDELVRFRSEARYPSSMRDILRSRKGWSIRKTEIDCSPVIVAEAAWV
ncbi:MAG: hypothetical protein V4681_00975 [Patescibacteria group bacterium]